MFVLYMFLLHLVFTCKGDTDFLCSKEFCSKGSGSNGEGCTDVIPPGCQNKGVMLQSPTPCNCCQYCIGYLEEGAECNPGNQGSATVQNICGPGLTCAKNEKGSEICIPMKETKCAEKQNRYDQTPSYAEISWRPVCDSEGNFGPVHCIPNSICYCIEPSNGKRIFGEAVFSDYATQMSCSCSLAAWEASKLGEKSDYFRCLPDGQYDELQCVDDECICVDKITGSPIGTTTVHASKLKKDILPCFNEEIHPDGRFEKSCAQEYKIILDEVSKWENENFEVLSIKLPKCTADGHYHRVQTPESGKGFRCVDPDGNLIDKYENDQGESNCNCAYTSWLLRKEGIKEIPVCNIDGTFRPWQCSRDKCYCVDENGDQNYDQVVSSSNANSLDCFQ
ncbi:hypothetical protein R5R35_000488 [Gryllus longicercus]|uniref:Thyroglobulin type-1 domain-containing protein n=1 Tax=Gryllus longicercus TaxID=2509291 RepID=A0AAN9Z207_9ORTH